jgi:hypothetical protein
MKNRWSASADCVSFPQNRQIETRVKSKKPLASVELTAAVISFLKPRFRVCQSSSPPANPSKIKQHQCRPA